MDGGADLNPPVRWGGRGDGRNPVTSEAPACRSCLPAKSLPISLVVSLMPISLGYLMHWTEPATADDSHAELEKKLWDAANQLWAGADLKPSEYSPTVLG
ncbi:MAG: hypothetical protein RLZZ398_2034, partial [Verrucomicrobiota bacterium]